MDKYKIVVKSWMTNYTTFMNKDSFLVKTNEKEMPLCIMYGEILQETPKMIKMNLHGDIKDKKITTCMKCGKHLTNEVSQFFGIGPECGNHNYINPFDTEEELKVAVKEMKEKLINIKWTGWILKSAIKSLIDLETNIDLITNTEDEFLQIIPQDTKEIEINIDINNSIKCSDEYSLFISFEYNEHILNIIRGYPERYWNSENKTWEISINYLDNLKNKLKDYNIIISDSHEILSRIKEKRRDHKLYC